MNRYKETAANFLRNHGMYYADYDFDSYVGFILGTGTNTSYIEENRKIRKLEKHPTAWS